MLPGFQATDLSAGWRYTTQRLCTLGLGFRRAFLPATIDAVRPGHRNSGGLPFPPIFPLDLRQPKQDTCDHPADRTPQINLLGHGNDTYVAGTPIRQDIDPILLPARQPIELPDDDGRDRPTINRVLQPRKRGPSEGVPRSISSNHRTAARATPCCWSQWMISAWLSVF